MKPKIKRAAALLLAAGAAWTLTGCDGAKYASERANSIYVVRENAEAEYRTTPVRRGTIALTESVRVTYFAARTASYGFGASGVYYESFEVAVGDQVKAGDTLATLESSEINGEIAKCEAEIAALSSERDRNRALIELYDERLAGRAELTGEGARADARGRQYEVAIRSAENRMSVLEVRLTELNAQRAGRVVTADIDGTVTYVRAVQPGESSVKGRTVVTVTDLSSCAFSATVEHAEVLSKDETYAVTIDGAEYALRLTTAEELGIEDAPMNAESTRTRVYFAPTVPSVNLKADASGRFTVTVETREDALYIPLDAVAQVDGKTCVYVPDESGLKTVREVTVGLKTARSCEILGGLSEGDKVIAN